MIALSVKQQQIVSAPIGQALQILAAAGSGKTRVLTERVRYLIENTKKDGVIALTFTNKAAEEMLARLDGISGLEDRCWVATIHAVAQRVLTQYANTIGLPSELHIYERDLDRKTVFLQSLRKNGVDVDAFLDVSDADTKKSRERIIQNYMEQFSVVKRELLTEEEVKQKYQSDKNFWQIFQAYQEALLESGGIDFDDILVYAYRILVEQPWCAQIYQAKYKHICVDEAQDLNKAQYEFIKALCGDKLKSLLMVGDPHQMIYGFNGSSADYLCQQFVKDFSPVRIELKENYRSSQAVIGLANKLKPSSLKAVFACAGKQEILEFANEQDEATWICKRIEELLKMKVSDEIEGDISLEKMVVIARNRFVFQVLESHLKKEQIPFMLKMGERQAEPTSVFGKVLDLAIRVRLNPKDWVDGKKLCSVLKIALPSAWGGEKMLGDFAVAAKQSEIPFSEIQTELLCAIQALDVDQPNLRKLSADFKKSLKAISVNPPIGTEAELERSLYELEDFERCWVALNRKGLGKSLIAFSNAMALGQITGNTSQSGLTLSTVHTMKGLEKDIVFLMGMCEGVFPDYRASTNQEIEEERNNAFVAVTRSRRWIYITSPKCRKMPWGSMKTQVQSQFVRQMLAD